MNLPSMQDTRLFVVGTGRSGTTLLRNLLRLQPCLHLPRETHWIPILYNMFGLRRVPHQELLDTVEQVYMAQGRTALRRILNEGRIKQKPFVSEWLQRLPSDGLADIAQFMNAFYQLLAERHGAVMCGDKTPDYGLCMSTLQVIWPEARFLHVYRDGRDVALSMSQIRSFRLLAAWGINHWWAVAYRKQYEAMLNEALAEQPLERFFNLWHSRLTRIFDERSRVRPGSYMEVEYEVLLRRPRDVLRQIGEFLALPEIGRWIDAAIPQIRNDNLGKNRNDPNHQHLTDRYGDCLAAMGFSV